MLVYSRGLVAYWDSSICESWLLLPAENLWGAGIRATLYILAMIYMFIGEYIKWLNQDISYVMVSFSNLMKSLIFILKKKQGQVRQ